MPNKISIKNLETHLKSTDNIFKNFSKEKLQQELETQKEFLSQAQEQNNAQAISDIKEDIEQIQISLREKQ